MKFKKVAVLTGGDSAEREVSLNTAKSVSAALSNLNINHTVVLAEGDFYNKLIKQNVDVVFIAMHGGVGENGCMQGMLEVLGIPYTGSGVMASAICMNKIYSKKLFKLHGIKTPIWQQLESPGDIDIALPVVIKPVSGGSTIATTIVKEEHQLEGAFKKVKDTTFGGVPSVMAEEYIPGREITVGILDGSPLPILEIKSVNEFYDYEAKYSDGMSEHYEVKDLSPALYKNIQDTAIKAFNVAGCSGMGRVDFRLNGDEPYILEINTIPGLTKTSLLPEAAELIGIDFNALIIKILESATIPS